MNYENFIQKYPGYQNDKLDDLVNNKMTMIQGHHYLDWTGAALAPDFLLAQQDYIRESLMGNPHSGHRPSERSSELIDEARKTILDYFNAGDRYDVIFTQNATAAIKLLHLYNFEDGRLLITDDNHNAVVGLRELAKAAGAPMRVVPFANKNFLLDEQRLKEELKAGAGKNKLFAYPAKSNYSGAQHPLEWVKLAQDHGWDVLLDVAAFVANGKLDLQEVQPQFVPVSFYKMFGWPTGLGCLLVRNDAIKKLEKKWFTGGTISLVSFADDFFQLEHGHVGYEDGTLNFLGIPAITRGLKFRKELGSTKERATSVAMYIYDELHGMKHNGHEIIVHSPRGADTVTYNFSGPDGFVSQKIFESFASDRKVYVRVGCFCNPGSSEHVNGDKATRINQQILKDYTNNYPDGRTVQKYVDDEALGAIRASCGYAARYQDAEALISASKAFLETL